MTVITDFPEGIKSGFLRRNPENGTFYYRSVSGGAPNITVMGEADELSIGVSIGRVGMEASVTAGEARLIAGHLDIAINAMDPNMRHVIDHAYRPHRRPPSMQVSIYANADGIEVSIGNGVSIVGIVIDPAIARETAFALTTGAQMLDDQAAAAATTEDHIEKGDDD